MLPRDPQAIRAKLAQTVLKVDSFFLRRTGFLAAQTILKLGEYNLNCVPATLGLEEARFLAVLTPAETALFNKYTAGLHILILTFDDPDNKDIARFPLRVGLTSIEPVPDRKNVCIIHLKIKSTPAEFILFLEDYQEELEARQKSWEDLGQGLRELTPALALEIGSGYGFVLSAQETRVSVEILRFHTKEIHLQWMDQAPVPPEGGPCQLRLAFQGTPLVLEGTLAPGGVFRPDFHPEWLNFVEECEFHTKLHARLRAKDGI
jgi:hypothetical protein